MREWYLTSHAAFLASSLNQLAATPEAVAVAAVGNRIRRTRAGSSAPDASRVALVLLRLAKTHAATDTRDVYGALVASAPARAACYLGRRPAGDEVRTLILQHWYQRCYLAAMDAELGLQQLLQTVTSEEARQVAACLELRRFHRIIEPDGIPVVNARRGAGLHLAEGKVDPATCPLRAVPAGTVRARVTDAWSQAEEAERIRWAQTAGVPTSTAAVSRWVDITGAEQSRLVAYWLDHHQGSPALPTFRGDPVPGPARIAVAVMFNQAPRQPPPAERDHAAVLPDQRGGARPAHDPGGDDAGRDVSRRRSRR